MGRAIFRVAILGLGLIGGSAAAVWRAHGHHVVGWSPRQATRDEALARGLLDSALGTSGEAVRDAEVVVFASPVLAIRDLMIDVGPHLRARTVVTDVASTKVACEVWANDLLPKNVDWVGGHPMAGREKAGIAFADASLFTDRTWVIVPPVAASDRAVATVTQLAGDAGSRTVTMSAVAHDRAVANVSHLPFVISTALSEAVLGDPRFADWGTVAATGLKDMTRLASGDATMHRDICATNRDEIADAIARYATILQDMAAKIRALPNPGIAPLGGALEPIDSFFTKAKVERDAWLPNVR